MSQHPSDDTKPNSTFTKLFGILVIVFILAIVVYKLAVSPADTDSDDTPKIAATMGKVDVQEEATETISDKEDSDGTDARAESSGTEDKSSDASTAAQDIKEINQFLVDWKSAWQKAAGPTGDPDAYFALYSDSFTAGKLSKDKWQESKKIRNQGKSWIEVWLSDIRVTNNNDGTYRVTFLQEYSSSNYSDKGNKELLVTKSDSGWQIISEKSL